MNTKLIIAGLCFWTAPLLVESCFWLSAALILVSGAWLVRFSRRTERRDSAEG